VGVLRAARLLVHASDAPPDSVAVARGTFDAAAAWFHAVSYGRLEFRVEPTPRWLALPAPSSAYIAAAGAERYLRDAVAAADWVEVLARLADGAYRVRVTAGR
jgi:hypothetical protein